MNEVLKAIESRRSVRKFKPDLPAKESIDAVVQAGLQAASGKNEQAAMVLVVLLNMVVINLILSFLIFRFVFHLSNRTASSDITII